MPTTYPINLSYNLSGNFDVVYNSLLDFQKFGELHPYMITVDLVKDQSPEFIEYSIREEIYFFGFIKNHPEYNAKVIEPEKNKRIKYTSQVKKNLFLEVEFTFAQNKNGSITIHEKIEVTCNKLVALIFLNILKKSHAKVFLNIKKLLQTDVEEPMLK